MLSTLASHGLPFWGFAIRWLCHVPSAVYWLETLRMPAPFRFQTPPLECDGLVHSRPQWVLDFLPHLANPPRPVKVLSPCVGVNAPERAVRELEFPWESVGDYDINPALRPALAKFTNAPDKLLVGRRQGSVLNVDVCDLDPETDGIVSGPPCPPFSSMGKRLVELDARSSVFVAVCTWILHLSRKCRLTWFIIENVSGITKRKKGTDTSFSEWFLSEMMRELPAGWHVELVQHNSAQCLLPQSRPRCFFVGSAAPLRATPFQRRVLSMAVPSWDRSTSSTS